MFLSVFHKLCIVSAYFVWFSMVFDDGFYCGCGADSGIGGVGNVNVLVSSCVSVSVAGKR